MRFAKALVLAVLVARDVPASTGREPRACDESALGRTARAPRVAVWAEALPALEVRNVTTRMSGSVRLYTPDGAVDESQRKVFERIASTIDTDPRPLSLRLEQLVVKAAYRFNGARILVVSAWRWRAGRHGTGEARRRFWTDRQRIRTRIRAWSGHRGTRGQR